MSQSIAVVTAVLLFAVGGAARGEADSDSVAEGIVRESLGVRPGEIVVVSGGPTEIDLMSFHQEYVEPLAQLFLEGRETGALRPEMDPQFAVVGLVGLANITLKCALVGIPLPEDFAKRTVDLYLNGVGTQ